MVDGVVIDMSEETSGPTLEEEAAAMDAPVETTEEPVVNERPEWLPEKFASAEEMAASYAELEGKLGQGEQKSEEIEEAMPESEEAAVEQLESAGLDFDTFSLEYQNEGSLSDESYANLEAAGIPKSVVDHYISATEQSIEANRNSIMEEVGGAEKYSELLGWAGDNLSDAEIDAFNGAIDSADMSSVSMAVKGLAARQAMESGREPSRNLSGSVGADNGGSYQSVSEMMADMNNPQYNSDSAFRAKVEAKLARSSIL